MPEKVFFTADHHFGHQKIIEYQPRPFSSLEEMDEKMIEIWNSQVSNSDRVYMVGDFAFYNPTKYITRINGNIHWIQGNHDKVSQTWVKAQRNIKSFSQVKLLRINGISISLCHYALRTWKQMDKGAWHLYGHSHGHLPSYRTSFDIGVDCHSFRLLEFDEVEAKMEILSKNNKDCKWKK